MALNRSGLAAYNVWLEKKGYQVVEEPVPQIVFPMGESQS
jgi:hypothetical protein